MKKVLSLSILTALLVVSLDMSTASANDSHKVGPKPLLRLHNVLRGNHGASNLSFDRSLSKKALQHSKEMAANGRLTHSSSLAPYLKGKAWKVAGENIGVTAAPSDADAITILEAAFENSPDHRRNILLKSFKHAGVGIWYDGSQYWVTVLFYG